MSLINLTVKHGQTQEEARTNLEKAVDDARGLFGAMIRRVEWAADRNRVRLEGAGFWAEMWVEPHDVHARGDIPVLGSFLGGSLAAGLTQVVRRNFPKSLP
jgi:Putative polyhydroxyalkanoic acid system protein (PHA_gran_rgn)